MMARTRGSRGRPAEPDDAPADRLETGGRTGEPGDRSHSPGAAASDSPGSGIGLGIGQGSGQGSGGAQDEELLTVSPFPGDLADELAAAEPARTGLAGPTLYLGAAVLVVAGFIGGAQAQRLWGAPQDTTVAGRPASGTRSVSRMPPGGAPAGGFGTGTGSATGPGLGAGNATTGTVQKVSGKVIYLKTASGQTVKVTTTGSTEVLLSVAGTVTDLKVGAAVVVQGRSGSGGVTATRVSQSDRAPGTAPAVGRSGASPP